MTLKVYAPIFLLTSTVLVGAPRMVSSRGEFHPATTQSLTEIDNSPTRSSNRLLQTQTNTNSPKPTLDFHGGERPADMIQKELSEIVGDTDPIDWQNIKIKTNYKLIKVVSHYQNLDTGFELLHLHNLSVDNYHESQVTHYTSKIQQADEQNIGGTIALPALIKNNKGKPLLVNRDQTEYVFKLKKDKLHGSFSLRQPIGESTILPATEKSFDPLGLLDQLHNVFEEIGEYQYELPYNSKIYNVTLTPRHFSPDKITIEIEIREVESLQTLTFALVYKQQ